MTPAVLLIHELRTLGVELRTKDDKILFRPASLVGPDLRERLALHKTDVLALVERINERAAIMEYDGGMPRLDAERAAYADVLPTLPTVDETPDSNVRQGVLSAVCAELTPTARTYVAAGAAWLGGER